MNVVVDTTKLDRDTRTVERKQGISRTPIAVLRSTDTPRVHKMHVADDTMPWLVRVTKRNDVSGPRADPLPPSS